MEKLIIYFKNAKSINVYPVGAHTDTSGNTCYYTGNCVGRGLSVIRDALGYKSKLKNKYTPGPQTREGLCDILKTFFPKRQMLVWCEKPCYKYYKNIRYCGDTRLFPGTPTIVHDSNKYAHAFAYATTKDGLSGHFLVGNPVTPDGLGIKIEFIIAIKI